MPGQYDYNVAVQIYSHRPPFWALIQAAALSAETDNRAALAAAFPAELAELQLRWLAPGGEVDPAQVVRTRAAAAGAAVGATAHRCTVCASSRGECEVLRESSGRPCCSVCAGSNTHRSIR